MTKAKFERIISDFVEELRKVAPKDTGNLANNGIKYVVEGDKATIYVDFTGVDAKCIVPYMPYTNEPWVSPKWGGKKNPNEAWWNNAILPILQKIAHKYKGEIK